MKSFEEKIFDMTFPPKTGLTIRERSNPQKIKKYVKYNLDLLAPDDSFCFKVWRMKLLQCHDEID